MKKIIIFSLIILTIAGIGAFVVYQYYLPDVIADAMVAEELPSYLPKPVRNKISEIREPVNAGAEDVVRQIHRSEVPMEKILEMIDRTTEESSERMLDELSQAKVRSTDEAFDIIKKHVQADFDIEILRKPFNENVNLQMIKKGIHYGKINKKSKDIDLETAKLIAKRILIEKEKQLK